MRQNVLQRVVQCVVVMVAVTGCATLDAGTSPIGMPGLGDATRGDPYVVVPRGEHSPLPIVRLDFADISQATDHMGKPSPTKAPGTIVAAFALSTPDALRRILADRGVVPVSDHSWPSPKKLDATIIAVLTVELQQTRTANCCGTVSVLASLLLVGVDAAGSKVWDTRLHVSSQPHRWENSYELTWGDPQPREDDRTVQIHIAAAEAYRALLHEADEALTVARLSALAPPTNAAAAHQNDEGIK